jgi:hypothetical protein
MRFLWGAPLCASAIVVGTAASPVHAFGAPEGVRLDYAADAACPPESRFAEDVLARTSRVRFGEAGGSARVIHIRITRRNGEFAGRLQIGASGRISEAREIAGAACDDVTSALALFTALAIDPSASTTARSAPATPEPSVTGVRSPAPVAPSPPPSLPAASAWIWAMGLNAEALFIAAPDGLYGASLVASTSRMSASPIALRGRVFLGYARSPRVAAGPGVADVQLPYLGAAICPFEGALSQVMKLQICGGSRIGVYVARGAEVDVPESATQWWVDAEMRGGIGWRWSDQWTFETSAAAVMPLTRYTLVFDAPATLVYRSPAVGLGIGLGVTWRIR